MPYRRGPKRTADSALLTPLTGRGGQILLDNGPILY